MATHRKPDEIQRILQRCIDLEASGGDIISYLSSEHYLSPKATWFNFQRIYLGRKPFQYTTGKPTVKKGEKTMTGINRAETVPGLMEAIRAGKDPREYLESLGCKNPTKTYQNMRQFIREKHPELASELPNLRNGWGKPSKSARPMKAETPEKPKTAADAMDGCMAAADKFFDECIEMGLKLKPEQPKICQPVVYDSMTVREVEGNFGRYRRSDIGGVTYIDFENADGLDTLSFTVEQWRSFRKEQERAAMILGVEL